MRDIDSEETRQAVRRELAKFAVGASREQLEKARDRALEPFQRKQLRRTLAEVGPLDLGGGSTAEDCKNAAQALAEAFAELPEDTEQPELERVRRQVLDDSKEEIKERAEIEAKVQSSLEYVDRYLKKEYKFDSFSERLQEERELRQIIEPKLRDELQAREMDDEDIRVFIEELVDEEPGEEEDRQQ